MGFSDSGHVCHNPQYSPSSIHVSDSGASSTGDICTFSNLAGRSMYMFPTFPWLSKVIQKLRSTQTGEIILIAPWWPSQPWFPHLLRMCVDHPHILPYCLDLLSQIGQILDGMSYHLHTRRLSCSTYKQQDFQKRSLGLQQPLEDIFFSKTAEQHS